MHTYIHTYILFILIYVFTYIRTYFNTCRAGITCEEIDRIVHEATIERGAYPSPLNYHLFPKSVCTSVNEVSKLVRECNVVNMYTCIFVNEWNVYCVTFWVKCELCLCSGGHTCMNTSMYTFLRVLLRSLYLYSLFDMNWTRNSYKFDAEFL